MNISHPEFFHPKFGNCAEEGRDWREGSGEARSPPGGAAWEQGPRATLTCASYLKRARPLTPR